MTRSELFDALSGIAVVLLVGEVVSAWAKKRYPHARRQGVVWALVAVALNIILPGGQLGLVIVYDHEPQGCQLNLALFVVGLLAAVSWIGYVAFQFTAGRPWLRVLIVVLPFVVLGLRKFAIKRAERRFARLADAD